MNNKILKKTSKFYISMTLNVIEGLLSGFNFTVLYLIIKALVENSLSEELLFRLSGMLVLIFIVRLVIYSIAYTEGHIAGAEVTKRIRIFLGDKIKKISLSGFTKVKTGEYINVVTGAVNNYENILTHKLGDIIKNISLMSMLILFVTVVYLPAGLILFLAALLLIPALWLSFMKVKKFGEQKNNILVQAVSDMVEYITGIQTFRAYGLGGMKNETVTASMKNFSDISYWYESKIIPAAVVFNIIVGFSIPAVIFIAGTDWINKSLDTATFIMLIMLPIIVCKLWGTLFTDFTSYKNMVISRRAIESVVNAEEESNQVTPFEPKSYEICFKSVIFSYDEKEPVLNGVNFTAENEKLTAIVGDSGSGKSTILSLISKYYEPQEGAVEIGGISIKDISAEKVLSQISMVEQDIFLFNDTIKNNIRYARPSASDEEIIEACKLANCHQFIKKMEQGYDTSVGENGNQLSGGERQRISIARAILKDSPILLLDEATASLDIENELAVKNAIRNLLTNKKTVIMIAHSLSIIQNADKILVVSDGKVIEQGNHEDLIEKQGKYSDMWCAEEKLLA